MEKINLNLYRGQTYQRNITISDFPLDITQLYLTVKETTNDKNIALQKKIGNGFTLMDIDDNGNKTYLLEIASEDTENLKTNFDYGYDISLKSDNYKKPLVMGVFRVEPVYTTKKDEK